MSSDTDWHFPVFILASLVLFVGVLRVALRARSETPSRWFVLGIASVIVIGGMSFARLGATGGFPVWVYYGLPAALTWVLPPLVFRMSAREAARYLPLAMLVAPVIHVAFSLLLGWKEYMPFLPVPTLGELFG